MGAIKKGQPREIVNIGYTKRRKTNQKHNIICVGHHYAQTNTKRHAPPYKQLEVKAIRTSYLCGNRNGHHNTEFRNIKTHNRTTQQFKEMSMTELNKKPRVNSGAREG